MGQALFDLEHAMSLKKEKLTLQEVNILMSWRSNAMRDFSVGFGGGSIFTWLATKRLGNLFRFNITLGAATAFGVYRFGRSVEKSVEHILSLEGSRIQSELASIMLKKYHDDPWVLQRLSKRFYSEQVYDDSSADRPKLRWRFRNFSGDPITHSQNTSYGEEIDSKEQNDVKNATVEPKQVHVNSVADNVESPFDLVFGLPQNAEEVPHPDPPITPRNQNLKEKRTRRRHRRHHRHHQEDSDI